MEKTNVNGVEIYIVDHFSLLKAEKVTEEGRKKLDEAMTKWCEFMTEFKKTHPIKIQMGDNIYDL